MSVARRLCLMLYVLCSVFALTALALPWVGPWTERATELLAIPWYYIAVEVCVVVSGVGVLIVLLRVLFTPPRRKVVEVIRLDNDRITVTKEAISAQVKHIVESEGSYKAQRVRVRMHKHAADVAVRIHPYTSVNVTEEGPRLHASIIESLATLVGDAIGRVNLEFIEADTLDPSRPSVVVQTSSDDEGDRSTQQLDAPVEITLPMRASSDVEDVVNGE